MLPERIAESVSSPRPISGEESESFTMSCASHNPVPYVSSSRVRRASICAAAVEACRKTFRNALHAVVLTGSLARDEASFIDAPGIGTRALGDAEFLLIFQQDSQLPTRQTIGDVQEEIERKLRAANLVCAIGLSSAYPSYLRNLRPHIYAYELRNCGRVLWGSTRILSLIPDFTSAEIPLEDGWRILSNRMIEHLAAVAAMGEPGAILTSEVLYSTVKLTLDMATSFLLFCGLYAPTYHKRFERLRTLAKAGTAEFAPPFSIREFADLVAWATRCKLSPQCERETADHQAERQIWLRAVTFAVSLWEWELARLTRSSEGATPASLMKRWMRQQSLGDRIRGWASLMRKLGWWQSIGNLPRWACLAPYASPRYRIYAAAGELFIALPFISGVASKSGPAVAEPSRAPEETFAHAVIREWLPVRRETEKINRPDWRHLVSDIAWNYGEFLKETRS